MNLYLTLQSNTQKNILLVSNIVIFISGLVALIVFYLKNTSEELNELGKNILFISILALLLHLLLFIYELINKFNGKYPHIAEFKLGAYLYSGAMISSITFGEHYFMRGTVFSIIVALIISGYYYIEKSYINSLSIEKNNAEISLVKMMNGLSPRGIKIMLILFDIVLFIICGYISILSFFSFLYGNLQPLDECLGILSLITTTLLVLVHIINIAFLCKKRIVQLSYFRFGHMLFAGLQLMYLFILANGSFVVQIIMVIVFIVVDIIGYFLLEQNLISRANADNNISQQDDKAYNQIDIDSH